MLKKFFGALLVLTLLVLPQKVSAESKEWVSKDFQFWQIKSIIILDATIKPELDYGGMIGLRGLQNAFWDKCSQNLSPVCKVYSETQAQQIIGEQIGVNFEKLSLEDPFKARQLVIANAYRVADAYLLGVVYSWGNSTYVAPSNVEYRAIVEHRVYYDNHGNVDHLDNPLIPTGVQNLPDGTDVAAIGMLFRVCKSKDGAIVFERQELNARPANVAQMDLFGGMTSKFASDVARKINKL